MSPALPQAQALLREMQAVASAARFRSKDGERLLARYIDDVQRMIPFLERNDLAGLQQFEPTLGFMRYNGINGLDGISSRLRKILQILADRDWISLENGRAVCLNNFGATEISQILPQKDWPAFNRALPSYAQDIATLRQLLANCRSTTQRQALNVRDLNRVIGIDIAQNGTPVLYFL